MEIPLNPEMGELYGTHFDSVEANIFRSKRPPVDVEIDGKKSTWYLVKGGLNTDQDKKVDPNGLISYEVYYDPINKSWLKCVSAREPRHEKMANRLKLSTQIARQALCVSDLPEMAQQLQDHPAVTFPEGTVFGFTSPHIGPSLEYCLKIARAKFPDALPPQIAEFLADAYNIAYNQAARLYLDHEFWMYDPNPGNILLHMGERGAHVVLIDFSNSTQMRHHYVAGEPGPELIEKKKLRALHDLHQRYQKQADIHQIPFFPQPLEHFRYYVAKQFTEHLNDQNPQMPQIDSPLTR